MEERNLLPDEEILIEAKSVSQMRAGGPILLTLGLLTFVIGIIVVVGDLYGLIPLSIGAVLAAIGIYFIAKAPLPTEIYVTNLRVFGIALIKTKGLFKPNVNKCFTVPLSAIVDIESVYQKNNAFHHQGKGQVAITDKGGTVVDFGYLTNAGEVYDELVSLIAKAN